MHDCTDTAEHSMHYTSSAGLTKMSLRYLHLLQQRFSGLTLALLGLSCYSSTVSSGYIALFLLGFQKFLHFQVLLQRFCSDGLLLLLTFAVFPSIANNGEQGHLLQGAITQTLYIQSSPNLEDRWRTINWRHL